VTVYLKKFPKYPCPHHPLYPVQTHQIPSSNPRNINNLICFKPTKDSTLKSRVSPHQALGCPRTRSPHPTGSNSASTRRAGRRSWSSFSTTMFSVGVEILATPGPQLQLKPITYRLPLVLPVVGLFQHCLEHLASGHDQKKRHVRGS